MRGRGPAPGDRGAKARWEAGVRETAGPGALVITWTGAVTPSSRSLVLDTRNHPSHLDTAFTSPATEKSQRKIFRNR